MAGAYEEDTDRFNSCIYYRYGQTRTADGTILEGNGVVPDIEVTLDRNVLLSGKDNQLEAAIDFLLNTIQK